MATKKKNQKKSEKVEKKVAEPRPEVKSNEHLFVMSTEEIFSLVQILAFSKDIFKQMSINVGIEGDLKGQEAFAARSELSAILLKKVSDIVNLGEPTSRDLH